MAKKLATENNKVHIYVGTPGILSLHTPSLIYKGDNIMVKGQKLKVEDIKHTGRSSYYPNHHFYELKFNPVK